ncbi:OLC1v1035633C1 [Oldenlandia corymbosa var. corymbosa]|uniref:OLC1v1035633C1 n=1 Tax=Oldenlandia corymbosa var. corymbosa TaxID=529605 RepID=A0AAV1CTY3_OLDCO|nr:OLC1v1035633C1 [Oldenlandia corymbosa var. corymbosa]
MMTNFKVTRQTPVLVRPARPTPHEMKPLSDIDDQEALRFQVSDILFYKTTFLNNDHGVKEKDPAEIIKSALAETLVFYYPFAGRLREGPGRKLMVDCTGEGVLFIEADADVTLEEFGKEIRPPFPCMDELLFNVPGSDGILHTPLLLIQVTRLRCGGFIFALRLNHTMSDAVGIVQFLMALSEIARGASTPSILPVWKRELMNARNPPKITYPHHEYDHIVPNPIDSDNLVYKTFFFGPEEIFSLRSYLPLHLRNKCSKFEVITACVWRCRVNALQLDPDQEVRVLYYVDARPKFDPPLPKGYYGNVLVTPVARTTAGKLTENPLEFAMELVMKAKSEVTEEYMKSNADLIVMGGRRPNVEKLSSSIFLVADLTRVGFDEVDFGWGKPVFVGLAIGDMQEIHMVSSNYLPSVNKKGEKGILVTICLPELAMKKFVQLIEMTVKRIE